MATNGRRNAAASSEALKVGAQIPTSGENASPTPAAVPFKPLASAYVHTALMNEKPTSGPMRTSITHQARDAISSRHSFVEQPAPRCLYVSARKTSSRVLSSGCERVSSASAQGCSECEVLKGATR